MKAKFKNDIDMLNYFASTSVFKFNFLCGLLLCLYGAFILCINQNNFIDSIIFPFQFPIFNTIFLSLFIINSLSTCYEFNKNNEIISRIISLFFVSLNKLIAFFVSTILLAGFHFNQIFNFTSLFNINIWIFSYSMKYDTFYFEVISSLITFGFLIFIFAILFNYAKKSRNLVI